MERTLTEAEVISAGELLAVMNEKRTIIGLTSIGDAERTAAWRDYDSAQRELLAIIPPVTEPLR